MEIIKEVIVVEGRDDEAAVHRAVEATTIATHGFGISKETFLLIEEAYRKRGIIIFTDPDTAGDNIRRRLTSRFPESKQAYLPQWEAKKNDDIGIENAKPQHIEQALRKAKCTVTKFREEFTTMDMIQYGLMGSVDSGRLRNILGKALGIGHANGKEFLKRLNQFAITREDFEREWNNCIHRER